jgi:hypothetical protein
VKVENVADNGSQREEVHPSPPRRPPAPQPGRNQDIATLFLSTAVATTLAAAPSRRQGRVERREAATGQSHWPPADANAGRRQRCLWSPEVDHARLAVLNANVSRIHADELAQQGRRQ